ncbi:O-acetyl-ADP-ribose deacetylase (regulator of RNase III), contains Macro domain [Dethiosulfatibacter aminovorans DSM 17477]|uniref:O-acetyl-ADP-ribose deacetylase (Regulator of RNase III), contains Macro domain n=1 Tax=Dethiosulfatibacter aminovorans DSM 17477 TaxID=1121476 RepID=A0A1M6LBX5_9FIRM|nr:O-acetyl-ADP-ribose deacetylase [Dethiosulfatibacter aminovorans]SHJ68731.1 O-acetyl-ADP-ribose deacetylase (regulator of RNase III), contains Macro domain [Dethiosulfatibacter aminovorans DSM 17477]
MPFEIIRNDITKVQVDAIVNAANKSLLGGGGVDGAIHRAAGKDLLAECRSLGGCETGQAKITKGYKLLAKYVIHTVGPVWHGGNCKELELLASCYRNSLALAKEYKLESIAFPLISAGAFGMPKDKALNVAMSVIGEFLMNNDMMVYMVVFDKDAVVLSEKVFKSIKQYIDDRYIEDNLLKNSANVYRGVFSETVTVFESKRKLEDLVNQTEESFSTMLLRLIDEKGKDDVETYNGANVDRRLFSKIRNNIGYKPSKYTAVAFAISLELNLDETKDLLMTAGYALSHSSKFDIIIEYFIENENYNIFEVNEALFYFEQKTLGC